MPSDRWSRPPAWGGKRHRPPMLDDGAANAARLVARFNQFERKWVSFSLPRCRGAAGTRWLDNGVVGRGSSGEGLLGEAMEEQPAGL